ncbi:pyridoxal phosphate enzyme (YggS family) [Enterococcus sp. PF1-24]|uniref:YggS family pyridoxal phosphate-dependent enzyme n=1 Tax=unclassified Enterococcus TaxID=2608891 RepID=UPI002473A1F2|nr:MULTISPECIES: YggS family pyridoxal phosphate-dependent enzyme [unclassified Enterococcus]MDH6364449.1 pyridoxal phosphate enzyme (YggS family) [Enterococcus sp. PFB1-1]MDH6401528.1 pyridoxal phosphate enzyme (YggS family) [Enterococcus sp. PF1-24]
MISENLNQIHAQIEEACALSQRNSKTVTVVGVTKTVTIAETKELVDQGIVHLAENRVDKLLEKKQALSNLDFIQWHLIGNLQRRKVKTIINEIDYFHALDSFSLAEEIEKRANHQICCFVEVNISREESKQGLASENVISFIQSLADFRKIKVIGLMTMAPFDASEDELHHVFGELHSLQQTINQMNLEHAPCTELSMGMSNDFSIAIEEGATYVRIGRLLFGDA